MSSQKSFQSHKKFTANEYRSYTHTRQSIYGQNVGQHPSPEAERDYNEYCQWRNQSNDSVRHYDRTLQTVTGKLEPDIHAMQQHQHQQMVYPAAQAATDTNFHASTRNAFLDNHPFAYSTMTERMRHEQLADESREEAEYYREAYDTHYQKSTPAPSRPVRQAPYGSYGASSAATPGLPRRAPVETRPVPSQSSGPRIPSASEAYGSYYSSGRRN